MDDPAALEALYRSDPRAFKEALPGALAERKEAILLQAWKERLFHEEDRAANPASTERIPARDLLLVVVLSLLAGTLVKLPAFLPNLDAADYFSNHFAGIVIGAPILYFLIRGACSLRVVIMVLGLLGGGLLYLNLLPGAPDADVRVLAGLHMGFFFWSLLGVAYTGGAWKSLGPRMQFIRYNGELLVHSSMILLGGSVLTGLTIALFFAIGLNVEKWFGNYVVVYGMTATPVVATLLVDRVTGSGMRFAPILARVFSPLFLIMTVGYLVTAVVQGQSPFSERGSLIVFNSLLLLVLGITILSTSGRRSDKAAGVSDTLNLALVSVTLVIDLVALAAILFRLTSYGITPNRVAVLGANVLAFIHLSGILRYGLPFLRHRSGPEQLEDWMVRFLPAYTAWSLVVALVLPLLFGFR